MGKKRKRRNGEEKEKKEKKCWVGQARSLRRKTKKK
jgi:hypothetical protein